MPHDHARRPRPLLHRGLLVASVAAVVWGALAFGAVYRWAYTPLAIACAAIGLVSILVERRGRPRLGGLAAAFAAILAAIALQLVPLELPTLQRVSPGTDAFLSEYDFTYQFIRSGGGAAESRPGDAVQLRHPISIAPEKTRTGAALFVAFALFLLGTTRVLSVVGVRGVSRWLIVFGAMLAVFGIAQRGLTTTPVRPLIYGFWQPKGEAETFGPFVNPNHFAGWMLMALPIALGAMFEVLLRILDSTPPGRRRIVNMAASPEFGGLMLLAAASLVMALSLLMTRSRSGLAACAVGGLMLGWLAARRASGSAKVSIASAGVLLLVALVGWAGIDTLTSKFVEEQSVKSVDMRLSAWKDTLAIVRNFPITGSGLDTYGTAMMVYQTGDRRLHFREAHNDYLQLAAEGGLLLGVPILAAIAVFVRSVRRRFREAPPVGTTYYARVGATVGLISIALQSAVEFSLQMPGNAALFVLLAAIALHQSPNLPITESDSSAIRAGKSGRQ